MNRKLGTAFILALLLLSTLIGTLLVNSARANPIFEHKHLEPPAIYLYSPTNKTYTEDVRLNLWVVEPWPQELVSISIYVDGEIYDYIPIDKEFYDYKKTDPYNVPRVTFSYFMNLSDGVHSLQVSAQNRGLIWNTVTGSTSKPLLEPVWSETIYFTLDRNAPEIILLHPENTTYYNPDVPLILEINEPFSKLSYVLNGEENVTLSANTTLYNIPLGSHNITVYAWDLAGNVGASETVTFTSKA